MVVFQIYERASRAGGIWRDSVWPDAGELDWMVSIRRRFGRRMLIS